MHGQEKILVSLNCKEENPKSQSRRVPPKTGPVAGPGICIIFLVLLCFPGQAQEVDTADTTPSRTRKNAVYLELLGNGILYSVNYERSFPVGEKLSLFGRLGANEYTGDSLLNIGKRNFNFIFGSGILYGTDQHYFEAGLAYTLATSYSDNLVALTAGYRYRARKGFLLRITPMYIYNTEKVDSFGNNPWIGISLGWAF